MGQEEGIQIISLGSLDHMLWLEGHQRAKDYTSGMSEWSEAREKRYKQGSMRISCTWSLAKVPVPHGLTGDSIVLKS